jgi:uncharacterized protein YegJ (DUF2314 family)
MHRASVVVDWLYLQGGKMIGNFTACALLERGPPKEAAAFMKQYGLNCDFLQAPLPTMPF